MTSLNGRLPAIYRRPDGAIDVAAIRRDHPVEALAATVTELKRSGDQLKGLCPLHPEQTASFFVSPGRDLFHCFGCGAGGDVVELQRLLDGVSFVEACRTLAGLPSDPAPRSPRRPGDAALAARRALEEWRAAGPVAGTPAAAYLLSRGLGGTWPGSLRYGRVPRFWDGNGRPGPREPVLLAAVQDAAGAVRGVQRTFLDRDGRRSRRGSPRLGLGRLRGGAVRLGPVAPSVMLAAGVEDALALRLMLPGATVWAALGDANLPQVAFPAAVRRVIVCGDADEPGRAAASAALTAYAGQGREVADLVPRAGKDFNEEWLALHA